jgi:outer membrane protein assembly factor BamB
MNSAKTLLVLVGLVLVPRSHAQDWPQFRGPTGQGISTDKGVPLNWGPDKNITWKVTLPGSGTSSPIVVGDRIFLTCYSGFREPGKPGRMDDLKRHVVCLSAKDGKQLWEQTVPSKLPEQDNIREGHGYATSTPVADKDRLYTFFGVSGVVAFSHDGQELWKASVGTRLNPHGWGSAAPLALHGDLLLINASSESDALVALDKKTGKEVWRTTGINESWHLPLVVDSMGKPVIVMAATQKVHGINPESGAKLWTCNTTIPWYMVPSPVAHDGVVYFLGGRSGVTSLAVRLGGSGDVTKSHLLWKQETGSNVTSPIYHDGHLYWANDQSGLAYCAEAKTGKVLYKERIGRIPQTYASPIMAEGRIYYTDRGGTTSVVAAQPEFKLLATNELGRRISVNASPAVSGGRILMRADNVLYCIGNADK